MIELCKNIILYLFPKKIFHITIVGEYGTNKPIFYLFNLIRLNYYQNVK